MSTYNIVAFERVFTCWSQLQFETFLAYEIVQTAEILEKNGLTFQDFWSRTFINIHILIWGKKILFAINNRMYMIFYSSGIELFKQLFLIKSVGKCRGYLENFTVFILLKMFTLLKMYPCSIILAAFCLPVK